MFTSPNCRHPKYPECPAYLHPIPSYHTYNPTLSRWASVRRGEEKHIFPYQENADVMFNSSLFYEISVLRRFAEPILREVPDTVPEYGEAKRMLKFLDNFIPISPEEIPPTSLLREFIGGSSFKY